LPSIGRPRSTRRAAASHKASVGRTLAKEPDSRLVLTVMRAVRTAQAVGAFVKPWR
jgi:hypothetical protein